MAQLVHHSPLGPLEIGGVLGRPEPGEPFDVDDDLAATLLKQSDIYQLANPPGIRELRALAKERGIALTGLKKKADIEAALAAADEKGEDQ